MASSRGPGRRTSLPPELDAIDLGWGDDEKGTVPVNHPVAPSPFPTEPPTVPRDARTAPARPENLRRPPSGQHPGLRRTPGRQASPSRPGNPLRKLSPAGLARISDRVTARPPDSDFARQVMETADRNATTVAPPEERQTAPEIDPEIFDRPTLDGSIEGIDLMPPTQGRPSAATGQGHSLLASDAVGKESQARPSVKGGTLASRIDAMLAEASEEPDLEAQNAPDDANDRNALIDLSDERRDVYARQVHPSEMPTAPPPEGFEVSRMRTVPRSPSVENLVRVSADPGEGRLPPQPALSERGRATPIGGRPVGSPPVGTPSGAGDPLREMRDRFAMGDFSGALERADAALQKNPESAEARSLAAKCKEVLYDMYASRIAGLDRTPRVIMGEDQVRWLSLDHRAGFLLSMIDGVSTVDDLLDVCGMKRLDAMRLLCSLLDQKVIELS